VQHTRMIHCGENRSSSPVQHTRMIHCGENRSSSPVQQAHVVHHAENRCSSPSQHTVSVSSTSQVIWQSTQPGSACGASTQMIWQSAQPTNTDLASSPVFWQSAQPGSLDAISSPPLAASSLPSAEDGCAQAYSPGTLLQIGDVLCLRGDAGHTSDIGATGGYFGHVLVALSPMRKLERSDSAWAVLKKELPRLNLDHVWKVKTLESTRRVAGLHQCELLMRASPASRKVAVVAEFREHSNELDFIDEESGGVELWRCPADIRHRICEEDVVAVTDELKSKEQNWSFLTAARAVFRSAALGPVPTKPGQAQNALLKEVKACWKEPPICTSVVVIFWQRLLCRLARASGQSQIELISRYMPLKADRGLPGELLDTMRRYGWTQVRSLNAVEL